MIGEQDLDLPWVAPNAPVFKVGDRVIVHLSGECRYQPLSLVEGYSGHEPGEDGQQGTVIPFPAHVFRSHHGHTVAIRYDTPILTPRYFYVQQFNGVYAPSELELLER